MSFLPRLAVVVFCLLLALVCATAGGGRTAGASQESPLSALADRPAVTTFVEADRPAPAGEAGGAAAIAAGASLPLDLDDPVDALALVASALRPPPLRHECADLSPRDMPTPWLASPLRPPRTLLG